MLLSISPFLWQLSTALALAGILCAVAFYKKWLDGGGAFSATVMGAVIWLAGGWNTALPMLFFFVSGSLFSKLPNKKRIVEDAKQSKPRDFVQVLCNGGIAAVCLLFWMMYKEIYWLVGYCTSIGISTADTWGSELGVRYGGKVVDIIGFKPLPTGISGGISAKGSLAALAGALLMGGLCGLLFQFAIVEVSIIAGFGFVGMLVDSLLGSRLQARYRLANGNQSESILPNQASVLEKGLAWMTNDAVNMLANFLVTTLSIYLIFCLAKS